MIQLNSGILVATVVITLLVAVAATQLDPATGHISPSSGVPSYDPAPWNAAFKITLRNVPFKGPNNWPYAPVSDVNTKVYCEAEGFDSTSPASVALDTCFYRNTTDSLFDYWTKVPSAALKNGNCYCYALNYFKGGYCLPGTSNGGSTRQQYQDKMTCPILNQAMVQDGAVRVSREAALSGQPSSGHYLAIMARPDGCIPGHCGDSDFHAMRKDSSGTWSWKLPDMAASDRDLEGRPITDPETAPLPGHYFVCGYYQVEPNKMSIGVSDRRVSSGPIGDTTLEDTYANVPGVTIDISPVPYNPGSPFPMRKNEIEVFGEDAAWERKKGSKEYEDWRKQQAADVQLESAGTISSSTNGTDSAGSGSGNSTGSGSGNSSPRSGDVDVKAGQVGGSTDSQSGRRRVRRMLVARPT